jgi:hypothetical protein
MEKTKFTKGKWVIDHEESGYNEHHVLATPISSYPNIIGFCDIYGDDEEAKANALLISKSPELLEMVEKQTKIIDGYLQEQANNGIYPPSLLPQIMKQRN